MIRNSRTYELRAIVAAAPSNRAHWSAQQRAAYAELKALESLKRIEARKGNSA